MIASKCVKDNYMLDIKPDIKSMITGIYECQKKLLFHRKILREVELDGSDDDINTLIKEIAILEKKLHELQRKLREKYEKWENIAWIAPGKCDENDHSIEYVNTRAATR